MEQRFRCSVFEVSERRARSAKTGRQATFYVLDPPTWINVIPLTEEDEVVFVRQYRAGSDEVSLEIPGGMMEPEDEGPKQAARRELLEETGFDCEKIERIGTIWPNPALQSNECHTYLASGAHKARPASPDPHEEIATKRVPLAKVPELIRTGAISHALVVVAFVWMLGLQHQSLAE
jgi:8-oxo-dGTP pyrophosphatase MutT (NUDIX family)